MPAPPDTGLFTRYVLENPYPAIALIVAALALGWLALREGVPGRLKIVSVAGFIGIAALTTEMLVTTAGERGERITRQLVRAAENGDVAGALALFSPDAALALGAPTNEGVGRPAIDRLAARLNAEWRIQSNRVTQLDAYTISRDEGRVHLGCMTDVGVGPVGSQWVIRVLRQPDGSWKIDHLTWISLGGERPPGEVVW